MSEFTQRARSGGQSAFRSMTHAAAEGSGAEGAEVVDNRAQAQQLAQMKATIDNGVAQRRMGPAAQLAAAPAQLEEDGGDGGGMVNDELVQGKFPAQLEEDGGDGGGMVNDELVQGKFPAQLEEDGGGGGLVNDELVQGKFPAQRQEPAGPARPNKTGIPDQVKSSMEKMSGVPLDDAKVHYNSSEPAQLNALAFAQGKEIHVAPGQEKHVPHEAWHLVQQAQGRVAETKQLKDGVPINDDPSLEMEADVMGAKAAGG